MRRSGLSLACVAFCLLLQPSWAASQVGSPDAVVKRVKERVAPDTRVAVFDVTVDRQGEGLVVKGEVDRPAARDAVLSALRDAGFAAVTDLVTILPVPALGNRHMGIVSVSVAQFRSKPSHMADFVTEALMGATLRLLKKQGSWYYAQLESDKYLGWINSGHLFAATDEEVARWQTAERAVVTRMYATVRRDPATTAEPVSDLVVGDVLQLAGTRGGWQAVEIPDGRKGYLETGIAVPYAAWQQSRVPTGDNLVKSAALFLGIPYLWGGTSVKGFDCSGLAKTVYRLNGIELARDADQQAAMGQSVEVDETFSEVRPGDLLFFGSKASAERPERVTHVAIWLGGREFIHASGSGMVRRNSFDPRSPVFSESLLKQLVKVRRIVKSGT